MLPSTRWWGNPLYFEDITLAEDFTAAPAMVLPWAAHGSEDVATFGALFISYFKDSKMPLFISHVVLIHVTNSIKSAVDITQDACLSPPQCHNMPLYLGGCAVRRPFVLVHHVFTSGSSCLLDNVNIIKTNIWKVDYPPVELVALFEATREGWCQTTHSEACWFCYHSNLPSCGTDHLGGHGSALL